jgi:glutaredoxin
MTRVGCHLCDDAKDALLRVQARHPFELIERDIDKDPALRALYNTEVPVILVDGRKLAKYRLDEAALIRRLQGARP